MANTDLIRFIKEARKRGFEDYEIRSPLSKEGWSSNAVEEAFNYLDSRIKSGSKMRVVVNLNKKVYAIVDRRARKNLLSVEEQFEDIVRRSAATTKVRKIGNEKIDDLLVSIFSRKKAK